MKLRRSHPRRQLAGRGDLVLLIPPRQLGAEEMTVLLDVLRQAQRATGVEFTVLSGATQVAVGKGGEA